MAATSQKPTPNFSWAFIVRLYNASLRLYPRSFRQRFEREMQDIFREALRDHGEQGSYVVMRFLLRELFEAPGSILNQHLEARTGWLQPYPLSIIVFSIVFVLLGLVENIPVFQQRFGWFGYLLTLLLIGCVCGLATGLYHPGRKRLFLVGGAMGFLLANTTVKSFFFQLFPEAMAVPGVGWRFLIPFLYPILTGSVFGFFIGIAYGTWRGFFHWVIRSSIGFFAGFFINRLSAALMQSFLLPSSTQNVNNLIGVISFLLIPYLLQGILLGTVFGAVSQKQRMTAS
jgi:hypothetical protein